MKASRIDVNKSDSDGWTGFYWAYQNGQMEILSLLLNDSRIDVTERFIYACKTGNTGIVSLLLTDSRIHVNNEDNDGKTGLMYACWNGHTEIVRLLSNDSRIDVNKAENRGFTGFMYACENGPREIVLLLLQDSRVDINKGDTFGRTGFLKACYNGHTEIVSSLLKDSRIDVNKGDKDGRTGFMHACIIGFGEIVCMLSESARVDCVCGWKESVDRRCRRVSENVMRDDDDVDERSLLYMWKNLNGIGIGVFHRGWYGWRGRNERMKEVWIYGDRERREENKRNSEMVCKRETEWRRVSDYILEEDITSVLILCHYEEVIQEELNEDVPDPEDIKIRVFEMESM